jgi:drug/metabolite transporter (DMT)-like permease
VVWLITALAAAVLSSVANIVDSHLVSKKMPSLMSFMIPMGFTQIVAAIILLILFPFQYNPGWAHLLIGFGSALLNASGFAIVLNTLRKSEVSRVIPVISISPIFVALLSIPILGEKLGYVQWLAILLTVAGAVLISIQRSHHDGKTRLQKSFFILLIVALMSATAAIGFKYALEKMSFWNVYSLVGISTAIVVFTVSLRKANLKELWSLPQRTQKILFVAGDQCLGIISGVLAFKAMGLGQISLVNPILNIRPAFVFIFSLILGWLFPKVINDRIDKGTIFIKVIAIVMITGGIIMITSGDTIINLFKGWFHLS